MTFQLSLFSDAAVQAAAAKTGKTKLNTEKPKFFRLENLSLLYPPASQKAKLDTNIAAIRALSNPNPDPLELIKFGGFGNLSEFVFSDRPKGATGQLIELDNLITEEERRSLRHSTLNAHYTSPDVIQAMWSMAERLGLSNHPLTILEPSMGIGSFFALSPESFATSQFYGVEKDLITGKIAQALYGSTAHIEVKGLEETDFAPASFDLVIGNWPFGNYPVTDKRFYINGKANLKGSSIHNYFWMKNMELCRPGGFVIGITSRFTMDSTKAEPVRQWLNLQSNMIAAYRLPVNAFQRVAGTEVTTDIIILQKLLRPEDYRADDWVESEDGLNRYYALNPDMLAGTMQEIGGRFQGAMECVAPEGFELSEWLNKAVKKLPEEIFDFTQVEQRSTSTKKGINPENKTWQYPWIAPYSIVQGNDMKFYKIMPGWGHETIDIPHSGTAARRLYGYIILRDAALNVLQANKEMVDDETLQQAQNSLNRVYDSFVRTNGPINNRGNKNALKDDSHYIFMQSIEDYDEESGKTTKTPLFSERIIKESEASREPANAAESLIMSVNKYGKLNMPYMVEIYGQTEEVIIAELGEKVFLNPATGEYEIAAIYLSGNLKDKLEEAETAGLTRNVQALKEVWPEPIKRHGIILSLASPWIPVVHIERFLSEIFCRDGVLNNRPYDHTMYAISRIGNGQTLVRVKPGSFTLIEYPKYSKYSTNAIEAMEIVTLALNGRRPRIYRTIDVPGGGTKREFDKEATIAAEAKLSDLEAEFVKWIWQNEGRADDVEQVYNDRFNTTVDVNWDLDFITEIPGLSPDLVPHNHQMKDINRMVLSVSHKLANVALIHQVGGGKSLIMIIGTMIMKHLGLIKASMHVVQKSTLPGYEREVYRAFPGAKVLALDTDAVNKTTRQQTLSRIITGGYDIIILTHDAFEMIPLKDHHYIKYMSDRIEEKQRAIDTAKDEGATGAVGYSVKREEKALENLQIKLTDLTDRLRENKDSGLMWDDLIPQFINYICVDEFHRYKNLPIETSVGQISGINTNQDTKRPIEMLLKTAWAAKECRLTTSSATPVSNSIVEVFVAQKYMQPKTLEDLGIQHFDDWRTTFGRIVTGIEVDPTGRGYRIHSRFKEFINAPELLRLFKEFASIRMRPDELPVNRPQLKIIPIETNPTDGQERYFDSCVKRMEDLPEDPRIDNPLKIISNASMVSLMPTLLIPEEVWLDEWESRFDSEQGERVNNHSDGDEKPKVDHCIDQVFKVWKETTNVKLPGHDKPENLTQLIFTEFGSPSGKKAGEANAYQHIKDALVAKGVPGDEIEFITDAKTAARRSALFDKVNAGQVRILIGGPETLGTGVNVQRLVAAIHLLTVPWNFTKDNQSIGRGHRPGNLCPVVEVYRYLTNGSLDAYRLQLCEGKYNFTNAFFIGDLGTGQRVVQDISGVDMPYAQMKAAISGNPWVIQKVSIESELKRLYIERESWTTNQMSLARQISREKERASKAGITAAIYQKVAGIIEENKEKILSLVDEENPDLFANIVEPSQSHSTREENYKSKEVLATLDETDGFSLRLELNRETFKVIHSEEDVALAGGDLKNFWTQPKKGVKKGVEYYEYEHHYYLSLVVVSDVFRDGQSTIKSFKVSENSDPKQRMATDAENLSRMTDNTFYTNKADTWTRDETASLERVEALERASESSFPKQDEILQVENELTAIDRKIEEIEIKKHEEKAKKGANDQKTNVVREQDLEIVF